MEFSTMTTAMMDDHNINSAQKNIVGAPYTDDTQNANEKQSVQNTCDNNTTAADISQVAAVDSGKFSGFGNLPKEKFEEEYLRLIKADIADAQKHLEELPERDRRGLTLDTLRHFHCGYLPKWILTKSRAEFSCGLYVNEETSKPKHLPPPSPRIIIPTHSMQHFNAVATERLDMDKAYWKQHAGTMELFGDPAALHADLIIVVEGELDAMSIWQCFQGNIAAVAILGCGNWKKTLLPKLNDLQGKKLLLLFDADKSGKKSAENLVDTLRNYGCLAVTKFIRDALPKEEQNYFGGKVDANDIIKYRSDEFLKNLLEKIIADAYKDFKTLEEKAAQWKQFVEANNARPEPQLSLPTSKNASKTAQEASQGVDYDTSNRNIDHDEIKLILKDFVHAKKLERDEWAIVGMILYRYGFTLDDFKEWSNKGDSRYDAKTCADQWHSFKTAGELHGKGYTIATLIHIAKQFGYETTKRLADLPDDERLTDETHNEPQEVLDEIFKGAGDDLRNGERIAIYGQDKIRWLVDDEKWLLYNDGIWQRRSGLNSCVMPMVKQMAAVLAKNANSKQQQAIADIFRKQKKVNAALFFLKGCREILIEAKDLNRHKNLIAVQNGVIDLETGKHYDLSPDFLITNQIAAIYDPAADTSFIENFFAEVLPDPETCRAVLRYIGYALTGEKNYHISEFWRGGGSNGKSTILDVLIKFFATYAVKLPSLALLESKRPVDGNTATPAIAQLDGDKRLAIIDELPRNARLDAALYKTITGDETVSARALYCNPRDIELRAKLILNGNHLPTFDVDDGGLQRRITNVEFTQKFEGDRADPDLPKKLTTPANRSAFLKILVAEAQNFYRDGLIESNAMKDAKFAYFAESDFIADFISEHCIIGDGGEVLRKTLEEKISSIYPRDCARLKKKELFRIIAAKLETAGATYTQDGHKHNIFKNVKLIDID